MEKMIKLLVVLIVSISHISCDKDNSQSEEWAQINGEFLVPVGTVLNVTP